MGMLQWFFGGREQAQSPEYAQHITDNEKEEAFLYGRAEVKLESSWPQYVSYDRNTGEMLITFKSGHRHYYSVSEDMALEFLRAGSHGSWCHQNLLGKKLPSGQYEGLVPNRSG